MKAFKPGAHAGRRRAQARAATAVRQVLPQPLPATSCKLLRWWPYDCADHAARPSAGFRGRISTGWLRSLAEVAPSSGARVSRSTPDGCPTRSDLFNKSEGLTMEKSTHEFFYQPMKSLPINGLPASSKIDLRDVCYPLKVCSYTLCEVIKPFPDQSYAIYSLSV